MAIKKYRVTVIVEVDEKSKGEGLAPQHKAQQLIADGAQVISPPTEFQPNLVCVMENGLFEIENEFDEIENEFDEIENEFDEIENEFESWESFIAELGDMYKSEDVEEIDLYGECHLEIFFMLQKKGLFRPVTIKSIKEEDMKGIMEWLKPHWEYTNDFWKHTD